MAKTRRLINKTGQQIANEKKRKEFAEQQAFKLRQRQFKSERMRQDVEAEKQKIAAAPVVQQKEEVAKKEAEARALFTQPEVQPQAEEIPVKQEVEPTPLLSLKGVAAGLSGEPVSIGGQTIQTGLRGQETEVLGGSLPIGIPAGVIGEAAPTLASTTVDYLNKASAAGKISSTGEVLSAPAKAVGISKNLKYTAATLLGFAGLGSAKSVVSSLLTAKVQKVEAEVSKLGEQLTKIPEAVSLGFSIDDDGKLYEYTPEMAISALEDIEQDLNEAERLLQAAGIGNAVLRITGRIGTAQAEIDKQRREITVARGKVLNILVNPSETLKSSRDFWRGLDLNG